MVGGSGWWLQFLIVSLVFTFGPRPQLKFGPSWTTLYVSYVLNLTFKIFLITPFFGAKIPFGIDWYSYWYSHWEKFNTFWWSRLSSRKTQEKVQDKSLGLVFVVRPKVLGLFRPRRSFETPGQPFWIFSSIGFRRALIKNRNSGTLMTLPTDCNTNCSCQKFLEVSLPSHRSRWYWGTPAPWEWYWESNCNCN